MSVAATPRPARLDSIDALRGIAMILMALDHTRDFFGSQAVSPTDVAHASTALFFTRWVTNLCAPVFFLLTGTGAALQEAHLAPPSLARHLVTRGLWLLVLDVVVMRCFGLQFNVDFKVTMLLVLWALGWSMITLAALVRLRTTAVAAIGAGLVLLHNLADPVRAASLGAWAPLWTLLHAPGFVSTDPAHLVFVSYPLVPWIGVTALGFALGRWYRATAAADRANTLVRLGLSLTVAFVALRALNRYGDPQPWAVQPDAMRTVLSFLNTAKYPPSLLFLLMTLGPALSILGILERGVPTLLRPATTIGRVPLFYYLVHFPLVHLLAVATCLVRYGDAHWMFESPTLAQFPFTQPPGWGYPLPVVYLVWIAAVMCLFPLCRRFAALKQARRDWWLSYL